MTTTDARKRLQDAMQAGKFAETAPATGSDRRESDLEDPARVRALIRSEVEAAEAESGPEAHGGAESVVVQAARVLRESLAASPGGKAWALSDANILADPDRLREQGWVGPDEARRLREEVAFLRQCNPQQGREARLRDLEAENARLTERVERLDRANSEYEHREAEQDIELERRRRIVLRQGKQLSRDQARVRRYEDALRGVAEKVRREMENYYTSTQNEGFEVALNIIEAALSETEGADHE